MKLTIKTSILQDLLSKVTKGASCNKMLPLTSLVELDARDNFALTTTDGNTYLTCLTSNFEGNLYAVVDVTLLTSLISKLTCDKVILEKADTTNCLIVTGNGTYKIELPVEENGHTITFPNPFKELEFDYQKDIKEEVYTTFIKSNKVALSTALNEPCYTGYYFGDRILTSDGYKICCNDYKLVEKPILVNAECMNLVELMKGTITMKLAGDKIVFSSDGMIIYSTLMNSIADFKVDAINNLVDKEFDFKAEINRNMILSVLDRISLFISPFERNLVHLHFTEYGLEISSLQMTGYELIKYSFINPVQDYECDIDAGKLRQQIASQVGETVEIWYANDRAIKMAIGDTIQVVALSIE